jgi:hypothetical protein
MLQLQHLLCLSKLAGSLKNLRRRPVFTRVQSSSCIVHLYLQQEFLFSIFNQPTMVDGELPNKQPKGAGQDPEALKRYRLMQEIKREKAKKALKEQGMIALITFGLIGVYWVTHHLELIERELLENPHWTIGKV